LRAVKSRETDLCGLRKEAEWNTIAGIPKKGKEASLFPELASSTAENNGKER